MTTDAKKADYENWKNGTTGEYAGFVIKPKLDFPESELKAGKHGWVITKGGCNAMPGATWAHTFDDAHHMIDVFLAADQNDQKFWHLLRAVDYWTKKMPRPAPAQQQVPATTDISVQEALNIVSSSVKQFSNTMGNMEIAHADEKARLLHLIEELTGAAVYMRSQTQKLLRDGEGTDEFYKTNFAIIEKFHLNNY